MLHRNQQAPANLTSSDCSFSAILNLCDLGAEYKSSQVKNVVLCVVVWCGVLFWLFFLLVARVGEAAWNPSPPNPTVPVQPAPIVLDLIRRPSVSLL